MTLRNTRHNYGSIAKWLHWSTALLFLASYVSVYYRHWFTDGEGDASWNALQIHLSVGLTVGVLVVLRIIWRLSNPSPDPAPGSRLAHLAAQAGHLALYAVMIIMPITGYLGTGVDTEYFFLFDIPGFNSTEWFLEGPGKDMSFKEFEKPIDFIHKAVLGEWLVWLLIVGHAGAALYHHYGLGDRTLKKMTSGAD